MEEQKERKELAKKLQQVIDSYNNEGDIDIDRLQSIRNELYTDPRPEPGHIVFVSGTRGLILHRSDNRIKGFVSDDWDIVTEYGEFLTFDDSISWKYIKDE